MGSMVLANVAKRFEIEPAQFEATLRATVIPTGCNNEQFTAFLMVANEYKLNPITKEIYAFPGKGGGIQPIVSIDGWLKIINRQEGFDGMEYEDKLDGNGNLISVTCRIFHKSRSRATEVTEYMSECRRETDVWKRWPARMLRHKATIQCARYAFGLSGIMDEDEYQRMEDTKRTEKPVSGVVVEASPNFYPQEQFEENFPKWRSAIESGRFTPEHVIKMASAKGLLSEQQIQIITECK
ncbi:phage recombination protein Bet [Candidatus Kaiserbacteria bacterium]|nr:phage recombination protein Bet [Candidatus Kaiserbacteria bacterium]